MSRSQFSRRPWRKSSCWKGGLEIVPSPGFLCCGRPAAPDAGDPGSTGWRRDSPGDARPVARMERELPQSRCVSCGAVQAEESRPRRLPAGRGSQSRSRAHSQGSRAASRSLPATAALGSQVAWAVVCARLRCSRDREAIPRCAAAVPEADADGMSPGQRMGYAARYPPSVQRSRGGGRPPGILVPLRS